MLMANMTSVGNVALTGMSDCVCPAMLSKPTGPSIHGMVSPSISCPASLTASTASWFSTKPNTCGVGSVLSPGLQPPSPQPTQVGHGNLVTRTLAKKLKTSRMEIYRRYRAHLQTEQGTYSILQVTVDRGPNKPPLEAHFGGVPLRWEQVGQNQ